MCDSKKATCFQVAFLLLNPAKDSHLIETAQSFDALRADDACAPSGLLANYLARAKAFTLAAKRLLSREALFLWKMPLSATESTTD
jgi:hypothetical protein